MTDKKVSPLSVKNLTRKADFRNYFICTGLIPVIQAFFCLFFEQLQLICFMKGFGTWVSVFAPLNRLIFKITAC